MNASALLVRAARQVTLPQIVDKMIELETQEHIRTGSHSSCGCSYCRALKDYVHFKRKAEYCYKQGDWRGLLDATETAEQYRDEKNILQGKGIQWNTHTLLSKFLARRGENNFALKPWNYTDHCPPVGRPAAGH